MRYPMIPSNRPPIFLNIPLHHGQPIFAPAPCTRKQNETGDPHEQPGKP